MENKIYKTLAYLYNQMKSVVSQDEVLDEVLDRKIASSPEVLDARGSFASVDERLGSITSSVDHTANRLYGTEEIVQLYNEILDNMNQEIETIKNTNPVVSLDDGNKLLVKVENRPQHKESLFTISPGGSASFYYSHDHFIYDVYIKELSTNTQTTITPTNNNTIYDSAVSEITDGVLSAREQYFEKIPFWHNTIISSREDNIFSCNGIGVVRALVNTPFLNDSSHVSNAFRPNIDWIVRSSRAEVIIQFDYDIQVGEFECETESAFGLVKREFYTSDTIDGTFNLVGDTSNNEPFVVNKVCRRLKVVFTVNRSGSDARFVVRNIFIGGKYYSESSGNIITTENVYIGDVTDSASIVALEESPIHLYRYVISPSQIDNTGLVYKPKNIKMVGSEFYTERGDRVTQDYIKNISDTILSPIYTYQDSMVDVNPSPSAIGAFGDYNVADYVSASIGKSYRVSKFYHLKVFIDGTEIILSQNDVGKMISQTIGNKHVSFYVKHVYPHHHLKLRVFCSQDVEVSMEFITPRDLTSRRTSYPAMDYCSSSTTHSISSSLAHYPFDITKISTTYNCYTTNYSWEYVWGYVSGSWKWHWTWVNKGSTNHSYNATHTLHFALMDNDNISNKYTSNGYTQITSTRLFRYKCTLTGKNVTAIVGFNDLNHVAECVNQEGIFNYLGGTVNSKNTEYIAYKELGSKQKVTSINADFNGMDNNVTFALSDDGITYFTYNDTTDQWVSSGGGMSYALLSVVSPKAFANLFRTGKVYVKVILSNRLAQLNSVTVNCDKDEFVMISLDEIDLFGMTSEDLSRIPGSVIYDVIDKSESLSLLTWIKAKSIFHKYKYAGYDIREHGNVFWTKNTGQVTEKMSNNSVLLLNETQKELDVKVEQKVIMDEVVSIQDDDAKKQLDGLTQDMSDLGKEQTSLDGKLLQVMQDMELMNKRDGWLGFGESVESLPDTFPPYLFPEFATKKLPLLPPGASAEVDNIDSVRHIQLWDTSKRPVPETIEYKTTSDNSHLYTQSDGVFVASGYQLNREYDTNNAYLLSESITSQDASSFVTPNYTCTSRYADGVDIGHDTGRGVGLGKRVLQCPDDSINGWHYYFSNDNTAYFYLSGEDRRWVDLDFVLNEPQYMYDIRGLDFGVWNTRGINSDGYAQQSLGSLPNQITTFFIDEKGNGDWVQVASYKSRHLNQVVSIKKEVRNIRIRLELPYNVDKGCGWVSFKHLDFMYCPIRYVHDTQATIKPSEMISTSGYKEIMSCYAESTILGTNCDIRYFLEDATGRYFVFSGTSASPSQYDSPSYPVGMTQAQFNALTKEQLAYFLGKKSFRPVALLNSDDGHHTPNLKSISFSYAQEYSESTELVDQRDFGIIYDSDNKKVIIKNKTNSNKTITAVIS